MSIQIHTLQIAASILATYCFDVRCLLVQPLWVWLVAREIIDIVIKISRYRYAAHILARPSPPCCGIADIYRLDYSHQQSITADEHQATGDAAHPRTHQSASSLANVPRVPCGGAGGPVTRATVCTPRGLVTARKVLSAKCTRCIRSTV